VIQVTFLRVPRAARQCEWYAAHTNEEDRKFLLRKAKEWTLGRRSKKPLVAGRRRRFEIRVEQAPFCVTLPTTSIRARSCPIQTKMDASAQSIGRSFSAITLSRRFRGLRLEHSHQLRAASAAFLIAMTPGLLSGDAPLSRNQTAKYAAPRKSKPYDEQARERSRHFPNPRKSPILKGG